MIYYSLNSKHISKQQSPTLTRQIIFHPHEGCEGYQSQQQRTRIIYPPSLSLSASAIAKAFFSLFCQYYFTVALPERAFLESGVCKTTTSPSQYTRISSITQTTAQTVHLRNRYSRILHENIHSLKFLLCFCRLEMLLFYRRKKYFYTLYMKIFCWSFFYIF